ncbi:MAG: serine hydrolase [Gemmataceae bacterium]
MLAFRRAALLRAALLASFLAALLTPDARAQVEAIHGADTTRFNAFVRGLDAKGLRLDFASAAAEEGAAVFAAVAVANPERHAWEVRIVDSADVQKTFDGLIDKGYRLTSLWPFRLKDRTRYVGIWLKDGFRGEWQARFGVTPAVFQKLFDELVPKGYRVLQLSGAPDASGHRLTAVFIKDAATEWIARHDQSEKQYQTLFDTYSKKGFRPSSVSGYMTEDGLRFAAVFIKGLGDPEWTARHGMTAPGYQAYFNEMTGKGFRPSQVAAYPGAGGLRYGAVFVKGGEAVAPLGPLPANGLIAEGLEAFDETMRKFMADRHIGAGTLAVTYKGKLVVERAYGWSDREHMSLLGPQTPFRLASVSKPITLAALLKLIAEGKLKTSDRIVALLSLKALPGQTMDPRWKDITIQHLIEHKGGWDRDKAFDPMFRSVEIAKALGKDHPATSQEVIQYMLGQPLQFDPGSKSVYSNFGYCILGRVIEKVTGKSYLDYLRTDVLAPAGVKGITLGRTLPRFRNPKEPAYLDPGRGRNVFNLKTVETVSGPDGTFYLEAMDAHGGLIASARDVVRVLDHWWIDGSPRKATDTGRAYTFFGSLPGTWTAAIQLSNAVNMVALFNQRTDASGLKYEDIRPMLTKTANGIKAWPK